jgi:hypothetical protein
MKRILVVLFNEDRFNPIVSRVRRQRRSLFNYATAAVAHSIVPFALLAAIVLAAAPTVASASAGVGLWPAAYKDNAVPGDCGVFFLDNNQFCYIFDDSPLGPAVELGVKFTTAKPVIITGVRAYRVVDQQDTPTSATGSLWLSDGTLLARGDFGWQPVHGWQDLGFATPVPITPGETYIASYFAPTTPDTNPPIVKYAFKYYFFTNSAFTVGPITALQSAVDTGGNGVYCYVGQSCNLFPTNTYQDTNYWVTPLWVYDFNGFYPPVDNGVWNTAKAGSAIPVKFNLNGDLGLTILKAGYPQATPIACPAAGTASDPIEETVLASGSSLTYDAYADQYIYVWKTSKTWVSKCYRFDLGLNDDTSHTFNVQFVK